MTNEKKDTTFLGFNIKQWIGLVATIFFSYYLTNELIHPLWSPKISDYEVTPMHIQSMKDNDKVDYYLISKISYNVDVPLFRSNTSIDFRLIKDHDYWRSNIELVCYLKEITPYVFVDYTEICDNLNFKKIEEIDAKITAKVIPKGTEIKQVKSTVYFREKLKYSEESSLHRDDPGWYAASIVYPGGINRDIVSTGTQFLGLGITEGNSIKYKFIELVVKNEVDLPIKGYKVKVNLNEEAYNEICYDGIRIHEETIKDEEYLSVNLNEEETKRFLIMNKADEDFIEYFSKEEDTIIFNFKEDNFCSDGWIKYKEIFERQD